MADLTALWVILIVCGSIIILGVFVAVVKSCAEKRDGREDRHNIMEMGYHYRGKSAHLSTLSFPPSSLRPRPRIDGGGGKEVEIYEVSRAHGRRLRRGNGGGEGNNGGGRERGSRRGGRGGDGGGEDSKPPHGHPSHSLGPPPPAAFIPLGYRTPPNLPPLEIFPKRPRGHPPTGGASAGPKFLRFNTKLEADDKTKRKARSKKPDDPATASSRATEQMKRQEEAQLRLAQGRRNPRYMTNVPRQAVFERDR